MSSNGSKYDPNTVIAAANEKLKASDLEGGQFIFQSALFEWVDHAREGGAAEDEELIEAVATLWLAYAQFLVSAKQFKTAAEVYEDAIKCPVAGSTGRIYAEYARFAVERNKRKTAQDVYIKALVGGRDGVRVGGAVTDEQDRGLLWNEFLEMKRATNPDLTMESLQSAVQHEAAVPEPATSDEGPASKRPRLEDSTAAATTTTLERTTRSKTHVVTAENVEEAAKKLEIPNTAHGLPPDIMAAWMIRDGNYPPVPPDPPLFAPSPPKLSDPTAKDILGIDLAVQLAERLLSPSGNIVLENCRGLWTLQGLREHEATTNIKALDKTLMTENDRIESELEARLSVAGEASETVRQMNERERSSFHSNASQQRQHVLTEIAWDFRQLLFLQQQALATLDVPGFEEGPTVDAFALQLQSKICQYLHSAFYIRNRMGVEPHESMLKSQLKKLQKEQREGVSRSPKGNASPVPPVRLSPIPPPSYNNMGGSGQQMMQIPQPPPPSYSYQQPPQLQPMMGVPPQAAYPYGQPPMMMHQMPPNQMQGGLPPLPPNQQIPQPPPGNYPGQQPYQYYQH